MLKKNPKKAWPKSESSEARFTRVLFHSKRSVKTRSIAHDDRPTKSAYLKTGLKSGPDPNKGGRPAIPTKISSFTANLLRYTIVRVA